MEPRKKQLYLGLMLLGALALVVDRVLLPSGATEPAIVTAAPSSHSSRTRPAPALAATDASPIPEVPFPRGLIPLDPAADVRDLFAPPRKPDADSQADNDLDRAESETAPQRTTSAEFVTQHTLQAVMVNPRLRIAIIDDQWLRLGESVDECLLIGIEGEAARFQCPDGEAVLRVPTERVPARD